jgi:1-acyl-sn-glycerol-3-phosphate acyltransferase
MVRSVVVIIWTVLSTIPFAWGAVLASVFSPSGKGCHTVARMWARLILWVSGVKVHVRGLERLDRDRHYIFMSNHQSMFDIPVVMAALPFHFRWLAKAELFRIPLFGHGMQRCQYISIDRSNRKAAFESLKSAAAMIRQGASVLIFPEGTRSLSGSIQPFKKGGFILAVDSGATIVPMVLQGTREIMAKKRLIIKPGEVTIFIYDPIDCCDYSRKNKDKLIERVRAVISKGFVSPNGAA